LAVQPQGPVFDVVDVVADAFGEIGLASQSVDLRPAGHAGFDEMTGEVMRNVSREFFDVMRALGAGADEAHFAAENIPVLGEFIEVPAAHEGADPEQALVAGGGALMSVIGRGRRGDHAPQFEERERAMIGADALLPKEDRSVGGFPFDERGEDENERERRHEANEGADQIEGAFGDTIEEAGDGEVFYADDGNTADGLESQAAEENRESGGKNFPLHVTAFTATGDLGELRRREIEAGGE